MDTYAVYRFTRRHRRRFRLFPSAANNNTAQELLMAHSFENFLEWVNEHFTSSHVLELQESAGGSTEAIIIDTSLPDSRYTKRRAAFGILLKELKRLPDKSPRPSNHSDEIKTTVIPIIKGEGQ
jgi:hypothetical protein